MEHGQLEHEGWQGESEDGGAHLDTVLADVALDLGQVLVERLLDVRHLVEDGRSSARRRVPRVLAGLDRELGQLVLLLREELLDGLVRLGVEAALRDDGDRLLVEVGREALRLGAAARREAKLRRSADEQGEGRERVERERGRTACRRAS